MATEGNGDVDVMVQAADGASRPLSRDMAAITALKVATVVVTFATQIVLARLLGPAGKGIVDFYWLAVYVTTEFGGLGLASGILFVVTRRGAPASAGNGLALLFALGLGLVSAAALGAYYALTTLPFYAFAIAAAAIGAPFAFYRQYWANLYIAVDRAPTTYVAAFLTSFLTVTGLTVLWGLHALRPTSAIVVVLGAAVGVTLVVGVATRRRYGFATDRAVGREAFGYSMKLYPGLLSNVVHYRADQYLVGVLLGPAALGIYALAAKLSEVFWYLDDVIITAALYRITKLERSESWALVRRIAGSIALLGLAAILITYFFGEPLVVLLFGAEFALAGKVLLPLLVGTTSWSVARAIAQFLSYQLERPLLNTAGAAATAAINVAILLVLFLGGKRPGLVTVGCVTMVTYSVLPGLYYLFIRIVWKREAR